MFSTSRSTSSRSRFRPTLSLVISMLALIVALGGTSYAAVKINGSQIINGTVPNKALKAQTIRGNKVRPGTLKGAHIDEATLSQVPFALAAGIAGRAEQVDDGAIGSLALGDVTRRTQTGSVAAGSAGSATAACLDGEQVIGGGNDGSFSFRVIASRNVGTTGWQVFVFNEGTGAATLTTYAFCLAP